MHEKRAHNLINTTLPKAVIGAYQGIVEQSVARVVTGLSTADKAISDTVMKWQEKGFQGFQDSAGRNWKIDNYARTVIKTTTYRTFREMRTRPAEELGIDTFYFSKKASAREMCAPLQHQIVTTGHARTEHGEKILALDDYGYGKPGGCLGINCGHMITPFIPGANYKPDLGEDVAEVTPEQAEENANAEAKQRALERSIRANKEKLHVAEKLGDKELIDKYKSKIGTQNAALKDYVDKHPFLKRDEERERYHYNDDAVQKLYKTIDKRSKKEYSEILQNLGNKAPKSYSDFKALDRDQKWQLRHDNRVISYLNGDIKERLNDRQKEQAKEAYWNFKKDGILFGDHGIARYIERLQRKNGTIKYNYQSILNIMSQPVNYISDRDGRHVRHYNRISIFTEPTTGVVVTVFPQNKIKKGFTKIE